MAEIDIKGMTDILERGAGNGCPLSQEVTNMHMNFAEQTKIFNEIKNDAMARPGNKLTFETPNFIVTDSNGKPDGNVIPQLKILNDGKMVFEAMKMVGGEDVFEGCMNQEALSKPKIGDSKPPQSK